MSVSLGALAAAAAFSAAVGARKAASPTVFATFAPRANGKTDAASSAAAPGLGFPSPSSGFDSSPNPRADGSLCSSRRRAWSAICPFRFDSRER